MTEASGLSDVDLAAALEAARDAAHKAPRDPHSKAWARHASEYTRLLMETKRRHRVVL